MPPNFGQFTLPHVVTFQGVLSSISRVYRPSDEALKASFDNARFMRNDPMVRECVDMRQRAVALLNWHIEPDDETDADQQWLADELTMLCEAIPRFMQYRFSLMHACWYGRAANQHKWGFKKINNRMQVLPLSWLPIHGDKLVFRYDDGSGDYNPDQIGIRVGPAYQVGDRIGGRWMVEDLQNKVQPTDYGLAYFLEPWERNLLALHKHELEDGEYEDPQNAGRIHGVGLRSVIYWTWYQKQEALAWLMEYLERSAFGIELWYYPWGNDRARTEMRTAAQERIGQGRNIILVPKPLGEEGMAYGVERIEPGLQGAEVVKDIITEYFGHQIKRYILGQTLTTEAGSTGLGSNLASIHLDTFMQIVKYDATNLEETLTTDLVEPLKRFNYKQYADVPVKFKIDTESPDVQEKLDALRKGFDMGLKLKAQSLYDALGEPAPEDTDEILSLATLQQATQQQGQPGQNGYKPTPPEQLQADADEVYGTISKEKDALQIEKSLGIQQSQNAERMRMARRQVVEKYRNERIEYLLSIYKPATRFDRKLSLDDAPIRMARELTNTFRYGLDQLSQDIRSMPAPQVTMEYHPPELQPVFNVPTQKVDVHVAPAKVEIPQQPAPQVNVQVNPTPVNITNPAPQINVSPAAPKIEVNVITPKRKRVPVRDDKGEIVEVIEVDDK
jgi:phage gp29-like protein